MYLPYEMKKILDYCEAQDNPKADVIKLMSITGMRVGEAVSIKHDDIDLTNMTISVNKTEVKVKRGTKVADHTKTEAGTRIISVKQCHKKFLSELYLKSSVNSYVFINVKKNKKGKNGRIGTQAIRRYLEEVCKTVGVPYKSTHSIRKYYESTMESYQVPDEIRKSQMGHTSINTTKKYYDRNLYSLQETQQALESVMGI